MNTARGGTAHAGPPPPPRTPGPAAACLALLCELLRARPEFAGPACAVLEDMAAHCREPLRVAVTGDVSCGKSTLVNALLGGRHAAVRWEETTAEVTWYRHPSLPPGLPPGPEHRMAAVQFPLADRIVLADTPGVNTTSGRGRVTENMLSAASDAAASATVLLYLSGAELMGGSRERLKRFVDLTRGEYGSGFNVVLVAAKADTYTAPWPSVEENLVVKSRIPGLCAVAVSQHLAMTVRAELLRPGHLATVRTLAEDSELAAAVPGGWHALELTARQRGVAIDALAALTEVVPLPCVAPALPLVADGTIGTLRGLSRYWEELSGLHALETALESLAEDSDILTVNAVTGRLHRLAARLGTTRANRIQRGLARLRRCPHFVLLDRRSAALQLRTPALRSVPDSDRATATALLRGESDGPLPPSVLDHWQQLAFQPGRSTEVGRVARLVIEAATAPPPVRADCSCTETLRKELRG